MSSSLNSCLDIFPQEKHFLFILRPLVPFVCQAISKLCDSIALQDGLRVLVVDSELDSCELLAVIFAQHGIETIIANCVSEAIEKIQLFQPDLLISEIVLPNEDGYSLIKTVRTFGTTHGGQVPAIALTVCAEERDRIQALAAGFSRHLPKPVNIDELIAAVACLTQQAQEASANPCQ